MPQKSTINASRFAPIKGDPKRNYVDKSTGKIVSRRQATQLSIGTTLEKRAKSNKPAATPVKQLAKLPRKQKVKFSSGKVSEWKAMKASNLQQVKEICKLLPPHTTIIVKAKGIPRDDTTSPTLMDTPKRGARRERLRWAAISTQFNSSDVEKELDKMLTRAEKTFETIDFFHVMAKGI